MDFSHFETLYKDGGNILAKDQIMVIKEYPILFSEEEGDDIFLPSSMDELKEAIKASTRSKKSWSRWLDHGDFIGLSGSHGSGIIRCN